MNLTSLIQKITGKQLERRRSRLSDYRQLVAQIAQGKEPDVDTVEHLLRNADKSLDELKADVELQKERMELRAKLDELPKLKAERDKLEQQYGAADKVFREAEAKFERITFPLRKRLDEIRHELASNATLEFQLFETCMDEDLVAETEAAEKQLGDARSRVGELRTKLAEAREKINCANKGELGFVKMKDRDLLEGRKEVPKEKVKGMEKELAEVEREIPKLEKAAGELRERMMEVQ